MLWLINRVEIDKRNRMRDEEREFSPVLPIVEECEELLEELFGEPKPNLKPSIGNPVFWIWWTIGVTLLVGITQI